MRIGLKPCLPGFSACFYQLCWCLGSESNKGASGWFMKVSCLFRAVRFGFVPLSFAKTH